MDVRWRRLDFKVSPHVEGRVFVGGPVLAFASFVEAYVTPSRTFALVPIQVLGNLLPERRLATATCMEQCTLLRVDGASFRRALEDPEAQRTVEKKVRPVVVHVVGFNAPAWHTIVIAVP